MKLKALRPYQFLIGDGPPEMGRTDDILSRVAHVLHVADWHGPFLTQDDKAIYISHFEMEDGKTFQEV